jgi:hypothetical protein
MLKVWLQGQEKERLSHSVGFLQWGMFIVSPLKEYTIGEDPQWAGWLGADHPPT